MAMVAVQNGVPGGPLPAERRRSVVGLAGPPRPAGQVTVGAWSSKQESILRPTPWGYARSNEPWSAKVPEHLLRHYGLSPRP